MLNNEENLNGKIIVITSVTQGCGAKYIATNLSNVQKFESENKIAIVDFDFINPFLAESLALHDETHNIDNLIENIDADFLNDELFLENMIHLKNKVHLLKGTKLLNHYKIFNEKHITTIIKLLRRNYDYSYIVVNNNNLNAGTIYSLFNADKEIIVARNNYTCLNKLPKTLELINQYKRDDSKVKFIFNQYSPVNKIDFIELMKENNIEIAGLVEYDSSTVDNVDILNNKFKIFKKSSPTQKMYQEILDRIFNENINNKEK